MESAEGQGALSQTDLAKIRSQRCYLEQSSQTTQENVQRFLETGLVPKSTPLKLYLVSSTFHLVRLAKDTEAYITALGNNDIKRIVLCGADDINRPSGPTKSGHYIKLMFFDVFSHLMTDATFLSAIANSVREA